MLNAIVKQVKTRIAQQTTTFDIDSQDIEARTKNNVIKIDGLEGEYTISGAQLGIASAGCLNGTHVFTGGETVTKCYFGDEEIKHALKARKINVGQAFKREVAVDAIIANETGNGIIVYVGSARALSTRDHSTESEDLTIKVSYTVGGLFKVKAKLVDELGCTEYDKLFIHSIAGARKEGTTLVRFGGVVDRFMAGDSYVVDLEFSYTDRMEMTEAFKQGLKHFDATIGGITTS